MKKLCLLALVLSGTIGFAQVPSHHWTVQMGGKGHETGHSIAVDQNGNVYTAGVFEQTVDFDPGVGTLNLTTQGAQDVYIQKLDSLGHLLWVKQINGESIHSISTDQHGNVYTVGHFRGTVDFDPGAGIYNLSSVGLGSSAFIHKMNSQGQFLWAKAMVGPDYSTGQSLVVDTNENVYLTGHFLRTVDFDPGTGTVNLTSKGKADLFVQKLNVNGDLVWVKQVSGFNTVAGQAIDKDNWGHLYLTGYFRSTVDFDPGTGVKNLVTNGNQDIFIQKLDTNGNLIWVKQIEGPDYALSQSIAIDDFGNVFSTGFFRGTVDFDPSSGVENRTSNSNSFDGYIHKLDPQGNFLWVAQIGGVRSEEIKSITLDRKDGVYTTGYFEKTVDFDPGTGIENLTAVDRADFFIQKLDTDGNFEWVAQMKGMHQETGNDVAVDEKGNVYTTGYFLDTTDFDPALDTLQLVSNGKSDAFVQRLGGCRSTTIDVKTACGPYTWIDGKTYTSNNSSAIYFVAGGTGNGCDSVVKLNLTIHQSSSSNTHITACNDYTWSATGLTYTSSGIYKDTLVNAESCDSLLTLNLTINRVNTGTTKNGNILKSNASGATYQWLDCANGMQVLTGESNAVYVAATNGSYAVQVTQNNCVDTSACLSVTDIATNILENTLDKNLNLYPNPTNGLVTINWGNQQKDLVVRILNTTGQLIQSKNFHSATQLTLTLDETPGVYWVELLDQYGHKAVLRVLKK